VNVLLAIDTSVGSETVIGEVSARPWPFGSTLSVLTVVEPPYPSEIPELYIWAVKDSDRLVRDAAERLCARGLKAAAVVKEGDPKAVIVEEAERMRADLLIVGASGHSGITRFLVGSVARTAVRFAHCSVEIVRPPVQKERGDQNGMRVLLATDGSECSVVAAESIAKRPWPSNSEFAIVSVVEPDAPTLSYPTALLDPATINALGAANVERAQKAIAEAEGTLSSSGLKVSYKVLIPIARPKERILDEADKFQADLVVVGSHGRRGIKRFLLGSVSEVVAMHANCSVEVIR
jgi:nucleotide-binding universal stress UspA family protein